MSAKLKDMFVPVTELKVGDIRTLGGYAITEIRISKSGKTAWITDGMGTEKISTACSVAVTR